MSNKAGVITNEKAVKKILIVWKVIMVMFFLIVVANIISPLILKSDAYYVQKAGCYGFEINDVCIGLVKYNRMIDVRT